MLNIADLNIADLNIAPAPSAATTTAATVASHDRDPSGLVPGSITARALFECWSGTPVIIADSPPGAGKTTLVVDVLDQLVGRSDLKVILASPTRRGMADLAGRLVEQFGTGPDAPKVACTLKATDPQVEGVVRQLKPGERGVIVRTISSCAYSPPTCDIMVIDEAYQSTFADVSTAADGADQVLLVGDPGQIGPVVTTNTSAWERHKAAPHMRAPEVFAQDPDAVVLQMDATYRVGPATVAAIAPLYGFPFVSKRPERMLLDHDGLPMPELGHLRIPSAESVDDLAPMLAVADLAAGMIGRTVRTADGERTLTGADVAVVVSHNVQSNGIAAILRSRGVLGVTVGTADRLQGGQWHAVVALDPLTGHQSAGSHQLTPGRLCVMASRHMSHLTWVSDPNWEQALLAAGEDDPQVLLGLAVRRHLIPA